jgi:dTDP-4-dehydrorhamnose 3,5-epimerase
MSDREMMRFQPTIVEGSMVIVPKRLRDGRGFFSRTWCTREFGTHGITEKFVQRNISHTRRRRTLRGLHFQRAPLADAKLVVCLAGAIYDVAADLRPGSKTFGQWVAVELSAESGTMLFIPPGCAHGFLTLEPNTMVEYLMSEFYCEELASGVRWDDALLNIRWPSRPLVVSERDRAWPDLIPAPKDH